MHNFLALAPHLGPNADPSTESHPCGAALYTRLRGSLCSESAREHQRRPTSQALPSAQVDGGHRSEQKVLS